MNRREILKGFGATMLSGYAMEAGAAIDLPSSSNAADIYRHIDSHLDSHLQRIQDFIRQKSISSQNVGVEECAQLLAGYLRELGAHAELAPTDGFPVVFGKYDAGAPRTIMVYCLYDVVYVNEKEWSSPPFAANVVELPSLGRAIIGRGADNQKGPLGALLNAMQSIIAVRGKLPANVLFVIEGEEELGSPHLGQFFARYMDQLKPASAVFMPGLSQDSTGQVGIDLGNKGIVYVEISVSGAKLKRGPTKFDLSSYHQSIVEGPVWYLMSALSTLTTHNGTRPAVQELNAAVAPATSEDRRMMEQMAEDGDIAKIWGQRMAVGEFADGLTGVELIERDLLKPSICIDGIWAGFTEPGTTNTLMPQKATAKVDVRLVPNMKAADVVPALRKHLDAHGFPASDITLLSGYDWSRTSPNTPVVKSLVSTFQKYGQKATLRPNTAASNPSYLMTAPPLSIPKIGGGLGHGAKQHSIDEYMVVEGRGKIAGLAEIEKFYVDLMQSNRKLIFCLFVAIFIFTGSICYGATISGTVTGPDGAPLEGAFISAQNSKTRITMIVLSDNVGRYHSDELPAGEYQISVRSVGFATEPRAGVKLAAKQKASFDFPMKQAIVKWSDLSLVQADALLPPSPGKAKWLRSCLICHGFQTRMAGVVRDADGWRDRLDYMRTTMHFSLGRGFTDEDAADVAAFLNQSFGKDSTLPSPENMPGYKETIRPQSTQSTNIVFIEYDMPGPSRMPFSAAQDKDGYFWIPEYGTANKIARLDAKTGEMKEFSVPVTTTAAIHSAYPAPDGTVWLAEQGPNRLGEWDPKTQKIVEFQDSYVAGKEGLMSGGSKHTIRVDPGGNIWATGDPLTRYDRETGKFTQIWDVPHPYGITTDRDGNIWFTSPETGQIGKADWKTLKTQQWTPPTKGTYERRIELDSKSIVWFGEYRGSKIGRFDPKSEEFKEYPIPGPDATPYGVGVDGDDYVWYSAYRQDVIGRLDPNTGTVTEYPFPHSENTIRELIRDSKGHLWYGTPSNNKVGYFYLTNSTPPSAHAAKK